MPEKYKETKEDVWSTIIGGALILIVLYFIGTWLVEKKESPPGNDQVQAEQ